MKWADLRISIIKANRSDLIAELSGLSYNDSIFFGAGSYTTSEKFIFVECRNPSNAVSRKDSWVWEIKI